MLLKTAKMTSKKKSARKTLALFLFLFAPVCEATACDTLAPRQNLAAAKTHGSGNFA
ncbi:MAG: hypothetical protein GY874_09930 [Desulfobacteraceae bacterium]|nr:hypothetical protein [Desulfobacteraceae bacterium]